MSKNLSRIFSLFLMTCALQADDDVAFVQYQEKPPAEEPDFFSPMRSNRLDIRQIEGKGIGYPCGYTTAELFVTPFSNFREYLPFADLRAHRLDNSTFASNIGLGFRFFSASECYIWGVNGYYDYRQTHRAIYRQMALGLEALGQHWDFRFNAYLPFGDQKSSPYHVNKIKKISTREFAMRGLDAEAAYHWTPMKETDVVLAFGPYHFHGTPDTNAIGGKIRAKAKFLNTVSVEGIVSYDNIFKCNVQGQIAFYIPLGSKMKEHGIVQSDCCSCLSLEHRLVQPVERSEIIVADHHHHH